MRVLTLLFLLAAAVAFISAMTTTAEAAPSASKSIKGSRSLSEVEALHNDRKNGLHKKIKHVHDLNTDYFDRYLKPNRYKAGRGRYWLVLFYSSWCATCDEYLAPLTEVADILHEREEGEEKVVLKQKHLKRGQMSIAKHDVTKDEAVAHKYGIEGYPTLILFDKDDDEKRVVYTGDRDTEAILEFVNANMKSVRLESRSRSKSMSKSISPEDK